MRFILSVRFDVHVTDSLSRAVHAFSSHVLMSFSVDETLLPMAVNLSRGSLFSVEMSPLWLKHTYSVLSALTRRHMPPTARSRLCNRDSACADVLARSAMSLAKSASVIVCAWYLLLLSFAYWKSFYFIKSIDGLRFLLAAHLLQCRSSLCLHPVSWLLLSCFYITSLWLWWFLWGCRWREIFAPPSLCEKNRKAAGLDELPPEVMKTRNFDDSLLR